MSLDSSSKKKKRKKKMIKTKNNLLEIEIISFPGFYNTILSEGHCDHSSEVDHFKELGIIPTDTDSLDVDFSYDYKAYQLDVCKAYAEALAEYLSEHDLASDIQFADMTSPTYYNYSTDRLFVKGIFNINKIQGILYTNQEKFQKYLSNNYTSGAGFISFIENDISQFMSEFKNLKREYISVALDFCMLLLYNGHESLNFDFSISAIEDIHLSSYLESIEILKDNEWVKLDY